MENMTGFVIETSVPMPQVNGIAGHHHTSHAERPSFAIEKNIPVPERDPSKNIFWKETMFPYKTMEVGDSFFVPAAAEELRKRATRLAAYCGQWAKQKGQEGKKFTTRRSESPSGVRIWRIQ